MHALPPPRGTLAIICLIVLHVPDIQQRNQILSIGSGSQERVFVNLRLADGRSVLVDSGSDYRRGELGLREMDIGDRVTIRGRNTTVQGCPAMLAENVQFTNPRQSGRGRDSQSQS